jgi:hypothetical protein
MGLNKANLSSALLVAALVLPIAAVHHLTRGRCGCLVVAGLRVGWGVALALSLRRVLPAENGTGRGSGEEGRFAPTWGGDNEGVVFGGEGHSAATKAGSGAATGG